MKRSPLYFVAAVAGCLIAAACSESSKSPLAPNTEVESNLTPLDSGGAKTQEDGGPPPIVPCDTTQRDGTGTGGSGNRC